MTFSESDQAYLTEVHKLVTEHLGEEGLKTLCFYLGIEYDDLPASGKVNKARELVVELNRQKRIDDLMAEMLKKFPQISWPDKPRDIPPEQSSNLHKSTNKGPLSINVISSHAGPGAWNQGEPLSPFQFVIKLDLVNQSPKPVILKSFAISAFEVPHERLNQNLPLGRLFFIENSNKFPINIFPHQIPGEYFGLIEYQIKIQFDDRKRLKFVPDSDAFQNYTIKLNYEYHDITRVMYTDSILVEGTFEEFKDAWLEQWNSHQRK